MKKTILLLLVCVICAFAYPQTPAIKFDHIGIKEGLPEEVVRSIKQDAQGYIWIATQNGLVRYDGYGYKVYQLGSTKQNEIGNTSIISIFEDRNKSIWVSTYQNGLFCYNRNTDSFQQFVYPKRGMALTIWSQDKNNDIWCSYFSRNEFGVSRFNKATRRYELFEFNTKSANHINGEQLFQMYQTLDGGIWLATSNGLYRYNGAGKGFKGYFTTTDTSKMRGFNPIYEAPSEPGVLWANTFHGNNFDLKLTRFDYRNQTIKNYSPGKKAGQLANTNVTSIYEDKRKQLWIAINSGIAKLDRKTGTFTNFLTRDTDKNDFGDFVETPKGNFWLNNKSGLVYFNSTTNQFKLYGQNDGPPYIAQKALDNTGQLWIASVGVFKSNYLKSVFNILKNVPGKPNGYPGGRSLITRADSNNYWVFNGSSIYKWNPLHAEFKAYINTNIPNCYELCQGDGGLLYLATANGLRCFNTITKKEVPVNNTPSDTAFLRKAGVNVIYRDRQGTIWIGTSLSGLASLDPKTKKLTQYPFKKGNNTVDATQDGKLDDQRVLSIYEDHDNTLWVGTNLGGLNRLDKITGKFYSYFNNDNRTLYCVRSIHQDHTGRMWVGTYLNGLFQFDKKSGKVVKTINEGSGLLHNNILSIHEDLSGHLLVLSQRGITRYDPETRKIQNFKAQTILPNEDIDRYGTTFMPDFESKQISFTLSEGIVSYNPLALAANTTVPIVHITGVTYSDPLSGSSATKLIPYEINNIELAHNQNRLEFDYIGLHFDDPSQNKYAYILEGYDKSWVQAGTLRRAVYTNLSPGTYTFRLRACNADGVWNNTGASITVVIHTALWMRWWAWLIYILLFTGAIYGFVNYRSRALKRQNLVLEEKITQRTQQLSAANEELSEQQEEITAQRDQLSATVNELKTTQTQLIQSEKLASLGELTAGIAHEIQNPLNFVNNFSEVSAELVEDMNAELDKGDIAEAKIIGADIKQNLEKICHHGKRADAIVKSMLQHSRTSSGQKEPTNLNGLADEYLRLSYHGLRANNKEFIAELVTQFDENLPKINVIPGDIGRSLLNLFNNAFYAVGKKSKTAGPDYKPIVEVRTAQRVGSVIISVKDNGVGIPDAIKDKIIQPFFTTKPTGEGTGLGLSLSYDIVVKGHGGKIDIVSEENAFTEFTVILPLS